MSSNVSWEEESPVQEFTKWQYLFPLGVDTALWCHHHDKSNHRSSCVALDQIHRPIVQLHLVTFVWFYSFIKYKLYSENIKNIWKIHNWTTYYLEKRWLNAVFFLIENMMLNANEGTVFREIDLGGENICGHMWAPHQSPKSHVERNTIEQQANPKESHL